FAWAARSEADDAPSPPHRGGGRGLRGTGRVGGAIAAPPRAAAGHRRPAQRWAAHLRTGRQHAGRVGLRALAALPLALAAADTDPDADADAAVGANFGRGAGQEAHGHGHRTKETLHLPRPSSRLRRAAALPVRAAPPA